VAACNLNQWALDFDGNLERIWESCQIAKSRGAHYRLGPELEICGYGCEDHFYEMDTITHSWESLIELIERGATDGLLCDFGMPILFRNVRWNCRVLVLNRQILLIRPKLAMADNGNYRESRWFTAYQPTATHAENMVLPVEFHRKFGQKTAPFGVQALVFEGGISIGCESCEELWTPAATHVESCLRGVEIIGNGSGSHHELRKLDVRLDLAVQSATRKCGGVYAYSNQRGCDGGRLYYDGGAFIACNGKLLAQAPQFSVDDDGVFVITATIDLDDVRSYRASIPSTGVQAAAEAADQFPESFVIVTDQTLLLPAKHPLTPTAPCSRLQHCPEEECCLGPACWLWDYLRRSGASGFLLPLSGGADSSSVAAIVGAMCHLVYAKVQANPKGTCAAECRRICGRQNDDDPAWIPSSPQQLAECILHTVFMGTENSSEITQSRAKRVAEAIGAYHLSIPIDAMVQAVVSVFVATTGLAPKYVVQGGTDAQDLALQNIQARLRMVTAYLFAQLLPWVRRRSGFLLVLGSANVDEGLRGYMTKYDCSSADLNPIGAISKGDLKKMLLWASQQYNMPVLAEIAAAPPTAELRPLASSSEHGDDDATREHSQLDEEEMGMTYEELGHFGKLRKISRCGPVSM
jgi:NAD+ synthase (glutamine-hydrolysing)